MLTLADDEGNSGGFVEVHVADIAYEFAMGVQLVIFRRPEA